MGWIWMKNGERVHTSFIGFNYDPLFTASPVISETTSKSYSLSTVNKGVKKDRIPCPKPYKKRF